MIGVTIGDPLRLARQDDAQQAMALELLVSAGAFASTSTTRLSYSRSTMPSNMRRQTARKSTSRPGQQLAIAAPAAS